MYKLLKTGPPQYRSSTIFEDATPEMVRDFFWDDEFRTSNRWDDMLLQHTMLEECGKTGTLVVRWVRKVRAFLVLEVSSYKDLLVCLLMSFCCACVVSLLLQ